MKRFGIFNMISNYNKHKDLIRAKIAGEPIEQYNNSETLGNILEIFIVLIIVMIIIWITALYLLISKWNHIPNWAKVIGILGLVVGSFGPFVTMIVVLATTK